MVFVSPLVDVFLISVALSVVLNIPYKYLVNQERVKQVKERVKTLSQESKKEQKAGNADKANALMKEAFKENSGVLTMTMKPMIVSMVVVIIVLPFIAGVYGDLSFNLNEQTTITIDDIEYTAAKTDTMVTLSSAQETVDCTTPCRQTVGKSLWNIQTTDTALTLQRVVALIPVSVPFFGDDLGWLGWYVLSSAFLMVIVRKFMKIQL